MENVQDFYLNINLDEFEKTLDFNKSFLYIKNDLDINKIKIEIDKNKTKLELANEYKKIKNESNEIFMNMAMFDYLEFINNSYFIDYDNYSEYINDYDSFKTFLNNYISNTSNYVNELLDIYNETLYN